MLLARLSLAGAPHRSFQDFLAGSLGNRLFPIRGIALVGSLYKMELEPHDRNRGIRSGASQDKSVGTKHHGVPARRQNRPAHIHLHRFALG